MTKPTRQGNILVVEDEALICVFIMECLQSEGYGVEMYTEGRPALVAAERSNFVCAVIDVGLPDISGVQIARKLQDCSPSTPIVLTSGYDQRELSEQFQVERGIQILAKPFDEQKLLGTIQALNVGSPDRLSRVLSGQIERNGISSSTG
jgi:DNA-binding response OmpR family regulator